MTGWPVAWKCFVACLFLDESQQPMWPHVRQSRRCTHRSPVARHCSQPCDWGVTGRICSTCGQVCGVIAVLLLVEAVSRFCACGRACSHLLEILVNKLDGHRPLAHGRGDALDASYVNVVLWPSSSICAVWCPAASYSVCVVVPSGLVTWVSSPCSSYR